MEKTEISTAGFFSAIYLSILVGVFMYMSNTEADVGSSDTVIRPLIYALLNIVLMIPAFLYIKYIGSESAFGFLNGKARAVSVVFSVLYCISFLMGLIGTASRFDLFASSVMFYQTDMSFFTVIILGVCAVISFLGIGAVTRGGVVFTVLVVLGTVAAVCTTLINEFDFLNFTPLFNESVPQLFSDRFGFSFFCNELSAFFVFLPKIRGNIKKGYFTWLGLTALTMSALGFCVVGELGTFADTQLFPVYAVSTLGGVGVFDRFDAIETAVWMLCVVLKLSLQLTVFKECFNNIFNSRFKYLPAIFAAAFADGVTIWVSHDIKRYRFLSLDAFFAVPFLVTAVLLPTVCLIIYATKRKRGKKLEKAV